MMCTSNRKRVPFPPLAACIYLASPAGASVPYEGSSSDLQTIAVTCGGERVDIAFVRRSDRLHSGLTAISVRGKVLALAEIESANALLKGQKLSAVQFMGCRKTQQGDVRHWISLEPPITAANAEQVSRSLWFYIRHGKIEVHERQPVD